MISTGQISTVPMAFMYVVQSTAGLLAVIWAINQVEDDIRKSHTHVCPLQDFYITDLVFPLPAQGTWEHWVLGNLSTIRRGFLIVCKCLAIPLASNVGEDLERVERVLEYFFMLLAWWIFCVLFMNFDVNLGREKTIMDKYLSLGRRRSALLTVHRAFCCIYRVAVNEIMVKVAQWKVFL